MVYRRHKTPQILCVLGVEWAQEVLSASQVFTQAVPSLEMLFLLGSYSFFDSRPPQLLCLP